MVSSALDTQSLKSVGESFASFPDPDMVSRQQKTTQKYYPYQTNNPGICGKWNAKSQAAYHRLASVLTKANRAAQSVVELECNNCKEKPVLTEVYVELYRQAQYDNKE